MLGDCHFFAGDFPAALSNYDHAIRLGADDWETLLARASTRAELEQFTEALDDLNSAATHDGAVFEVTMERASVLLRMERIDEAISVYSALLDRDQMDDGERIQILNARGNAYYEHDQLDNALSDLDSAEQIGSHDVDAFITMARIHELKGDLGLSISSYERAVECDEDNADGKNGLAWILATASDSTLQDGPRSELLACEALELAEPGDKHIVLDTLAAAHARQGNFNEAIEQQHKALELVDDNELKIDYKTRLELYSNQRTYEC